MRFVLFFCLLIFTLTSCENLFPEYSKLNSGIYYKIHYLGEGERVPAKDEYVKVALVYKTVDDSVIFNTQLNCYGGVKILNAEDEEYKKLMEAICILREGDSATFVLAQNNVKVDSFAISLGKDISWLKVNVKVKSIITKKEYEKEIDRIKWLRDREMIEQIKLLKYLENNNISKRNFRQGMYYVKQKEGEGDYPESGDAITIHYVASFIDGTIFDDTRKSNSPFVFNLGDPEQIIKGMDFGLRLMREKGKAKFIIPSQLGFGDKGSSTGIVPPFTTLIYEVELIEINNEII